MIEKKIIQLFEPKFETEECISELRKCFDIGWTGMGFKTKEFEEEWLKYTGLRNAHFINSNTSGLDLAIKVFKNKYKWRETSEIITTPMTFISTSHSILYNNLVPVFADVDESLCLDPVSVEKSISPQTKAIIYVGIGGNAQNLREIYKICESYNLKFIIDAAHMAGTFIEDLHIGNEADCTVFSFQAVKNLPTGDSGMICFKEIEFDQYVRKLSWMGIDKDTFARTKNLSQGGYSWKYNVEDLGIKANGNSIMASIGLVQLRYLERDNDRRREIANLYQENLSNLDEQLKLINIGKEIKSSRHLFQVIMNENRDELIQFLSDNGINCGVHYISNTKYELYRDAESNSAISENLDTRIISLPLHLRITDAEVIYISEKIREFCKK
jgi:dTDP-4-amino-4,6-dideoxygalactose transaminase